MEPIEIVKKILRIISILIDKSSFSENRFCSLFKNTILKIKDENNLYGDEDIKKISSFNKNYINIEELNNNNKFYNIIYELFLNKIYKFTKYEKNKNKIFLFKSFNQAYYYRKFIKYIGLFIDKYPETLNDDIIKEKLFEIVHSLDCDDKLYYQDFYFYISIYNIQFHYPKNDILIPDFEKFKVFEDENTSNILRLIKSEKSSVIYDLISELNPGNKLIQQLKIIKDEIRNNNVFNDEEFDTIKWDKINTKTERNFIEYLDKNKEDEDVIELEKYLQIEYELNQKFQFYFVKGIEDFLFLSNEDKYVIINSYSYKIPFYILTSDYNSLKESYDKGMQEDNLKETIKEIIEDKEFFKLIKDILNSGKVKEYCKNPIQYGKDQDEIIIYDKKLKKIISKNQNKPNIKDEIISDFNDYVELPDLLSSQEENVGDAENNENQINEIDLKSQLEIDYEYFISNIFNEKFFTDRIIYSFLPYGIKAFVSSIPKIVINICGNNITSFKNGKNSKEYKKILKALYTIVILHEILHLIRRENPKESNNNEYTPEQDKYGFEGGKSFIYHIFGSFSVIYIDLNFCEKVLDPKLWEEGNNTLKEEYKKLSGKKDDDIIKYMEEIGGIKCYDSIIEETGTIVEEDYYCC